jgi:hypothetical protein
MQTCPDPSEYQNESGPSGCDSFRNAEVLGKLGYSGSLVPGPLPRGGAIASDGDPLLPGCPPPPE